MRWAWDTHPLTAQRIDVLLAADPDRTIVRLRCHLDAAAWITGPLTESGSG